ncbi:MAG: hypothetical protein RMK18_03330 [Armatimonadota bacterium]|nr:hypothetical protein [Armatimonadota bacterium]MCX7777050.1 hypothetical protein [Armatimonadota bacterium]MDW8024882.1 hypothetical protein [Armatimonadota bacterium]
MRMKLIVSMLLTVFMLPLALLQASAQVKVTKINYHGWQNTYKLTNGAIEVYVTSDVGPRIIDIRPVGGNNIFYVRKDEVGRSGEKEFKLRGGWRLWLAPEVFEITWFPDNVACKVERLKDGTMRFIGPSEQKSGIQKVVDVLLDSKQPCVRVTARLRNVSKKPVTYSAWSMPVMRPGGKAIAPLDVGNLDAFAEVRRIILWSYANPTDQRFTFFNKLVIVDHAKVPKREKLIGRVRRHNDEAKIGVDTKQGWVAYYHPAERTLFIKRFPYNPKGTYPDGGCTVEIYSCYEFIEVECLSELATIHPGGEFAFPVDMWVFTKVPDLGKTESEIATTIRAYLNRTRRAK